MQVHCQNIRSGSRSIAQPTAGGRALSSCHKPLWSLRNQLPFRAIGIVQQQRDIDDAAVPVDVSRAARASIR
jgi:hypothetical protein